MLIGFTAVYREGFETVLFYEALLSFGQGLDRVDRARLRARHRGARRGDGRDLQARSPAAGEGVPLVRGDRC